MARYVVIEFDDNSVAETFVADHAETIRGDGQRIVGVFVKPGKTCDCPDMARANYGDKNWKFAGIGRGEKFGWWVCTRCNRPRKAGHQLNNQIRMAERFESPSWGDYEFEVTGLQITGVHKDQFKRKKKLRRKKVKNGG
jgi:hypothetical protein